MSEKDPKVFLAFYYAKSRRGAKTPDFIVGLNDTKIVVFHAGENAGKTPVPEAG